MVVGDRKGEEELTAVLPGICMSSESYLPTIGVCEIRREGGREGFGELVLQLPERVAEWVVNSFVQKEVMICTFWHRLRGLAAVI